MDMAEINNILKSYETKINDIKLSLNIDKIKQEMVKLEQKTIQKDFWNDKVTSQSIINELNDIKLKVNSFNELNMLYENINIAYEIYKQDDSDNELYKEIERDFNFLEEKFEKLESKTLLSKEYDKFNAIITIHAGAGGTEAQDWVEMLLRMYTRWAEKNNYEMEVYDINEGEEAGIKSVTFIIKGLYAYGYLKGEKGVHRLVRISPFDANSRRHTSFAAVFVMPEIDDKIKIEINSDDLEVGTYRASGAGGQHVNKTDSAVRIKHIPTGIVVACQTERSQIQNKETCIKMLRSKLYQYELNKSSEKLKEIKGELSENAWGSQIRSYVFCPYTLVKDHRTNIEMGNAESVIDGNITPFLIGYLKDIVNEK